MHKQNAGPDPEAQRLDAVRRYAILDTDPEDAFDRITAMAARRFAMPVSAISIVDSDRIWFKSRHGLELEQTGRGPGLCASAILAAEPHILSDAHNDPLARANPLVAGSLRLRFYAGVPLTAPDGHNLGTLWVMDRAPHTVAPAQIADLEALAVLVMDRMELRLSARNAVAQAQLMAREIDHRVMNSLQFVSSLLVMQSRAATADGAGADAAGALAMAATRVAAVASVHRHFYLAETPAISCVDFLRRLCADLAAIVGCSIDVEGDEGDVPTTAIQPIGLIVNELVTNAAKHGGRMVRVTWRSGAVHCVLSVSDDGAGLPEAFDIAASAGLGMKVVTSLAGQLQGALMAGPNPAGPGACFTLTLPPAAPVHR